MTRMPSGSFSRLRFAALSAGLLALTLSLACGESDKSRVQPADVQQIVGTLPSLRSIPAAGGVVVTTKDKLPKPVRDARLDEEWKGQYIVQYADVSPSIPLMLVTVDVYKSESAARKRAEAQPGVNDDLLGAFDDVAEVTDFPVTPPQAECAGMALKHAAIVPQYEVYCRVHTTVIYVRVTGTDEAESSGLASKVAVELAEAIGAAAAAPGS